MKIKKIMVILLIMVMMIISINSSVTYATTAKYYTDNNGNIYYHSTIDQDALYCLVNGKDYYVKLRFDGTSGMFKMIDYSDDYELLKSLGVNDEFYFGEPERWSSDIPSGFNLNSRVEFNNYNSTNQNTNTNTNTTTGNTVNNNTTTSKTVYFEDDKYKYTAIIENGTIKGGVQATSKEMINGSYSTYMLNYVDSRNANNAKYRSDYINKEFTVEQIKDWSSDSTSPTTYDSHSNNTGTGTITTPTTSSNGNTENRTYEDDNYTYTATIKDGNVERVIAVAKERNRNGEIVSYNLQRQNKNNNWYWGRSDIGVSFSESAIEYQWTSTTPSSSAYVNSKSGSGNPYTGSGDINPDNYAINPSVNDSGEATELVKRILGLINAGGAIILFITVTLLGLKYMVGSIEERAEYKKTMMPILVGSILLFATSTVVNLLYSFVSGL